MKKQVPVTAVIAGVLAIVLVGGLLVLVKPKRDEGERLDGEIAALQTQVDAAVKARQNPAKKPDVEIRYADLFQLSKALPGTEDMPGIILELDSLAAASGVKFVAIAPQPEVSKSVYASLPITFTFQGNYYDLTDFLYRVRNLVTVRDKTLTASGRLYTLDTLDMHEAPNSGFPNIEATLTLSAYVFGPGSVAAQPPVAGAAPATSASTTTTPASTSPAPAQTQPAPATTEPTPAPPVGSAALQGAP